MSSVSFEIFHKKDQDVSWGLISEETLPQVNISYFFFFPQNT